MTSETASPIRRCDLRVAKYHVTFRHLVQDPETLDHVDGPAMNLQLHEHAWDEKTRDGSPLMSTQQPFEGYLCRHEVAFLKGFPGKRFNLQWRFTVEEVS